jgi:hypothetical protein
MTDRTAAWRRRAEEATGSRPVAERGGSGGGVLDDIDALLAEDEADSDLTEGRGPAAPKGEDGWQPLL